METDNQSPADECGEERAGDGSVIDFETARSQKAIRREAAAEASPWDVANDVRDCPDNDELFRPEDAFGGTGAWTDIIERHGGEGDESTDDVGGDWIAGQIGGETRSTPIEGGADWLELTDVGVTRPQDDAENAFEGIEHVQW